MLTFLYVALSLVLDEGSGEVRYFSDISENPTLFTYMLLHAATTCKREQHH